RAQPPRRAGPGHVRPSHPHARPAPWDAGRAGSSPHPPGQRRRNRHARQPPPRAGRGAGLPRTRNPRLGRGHPRPRPRRPGGVGRRQPAACRRSGAAQAHRAAQRGGGRPGSLVMPKFSIRNPYFILVVALVLTIVGVVSLVRMPVDLFPAINLPEVVVATFYSGMPPEEVETEITSRFERFFTLGSGIEHMESRSLPGVSIIKIYFQPGTNADSDVTEITNLAMADLRRLPPGTLPPVVLKFDASSLPVSLVTLQGAGLNETQLRDVGQFAVRNQLATVPGASVPPPFGGKYRQIMVYTDPLKLEAYNLSPMDVVRAVNNSNLILPAGDARMGPFD